MGKKISVITIIISIFILSGLRLSFCQMGGIAMDAERKQIIKDAQKGDVESAIKLGEEYIKNDPGNIEVLITLGECYTGMGNFSRARELIKMAMDVDNKNLWAIKTMAKVYRVEAEQSKSASEKRKLLNSAESEIEKALKVDSRDAWINAEAALIYLLQGKKDDANKTIKKAIRVQPRDEYIKEIEQKITTAP